MFNYDHHYRNHYKQPDRTESKVSAMSFANNIPWGDDLVLPKLSTTFRLYFQNVNGIKLDEYGGEFSAICSMISHLQADVAVFAKLNWILPSTLSTTYFPHNSSAVSAIIILLCLLAPSHSKATRRYNVFLR
jgi:hypothetical protein